MTKAVTVLAVAGGSAYLVVVGSRLRTWGATDEEAAAAMPGEALMPEPGAALTHAISIATPPTSVWPWIAQLGQDKGGFYSYAWIENLGGARITNADHIDPAWPPPEPGGVLHLHPRLTLQILRVVPDELLVVGRPVTTGLGFQWIFQLLPEDSGTRLVVRERYVVPWAPARMLATVLTCGSAVMSRRMLLGIKARAEG